MYHDISVCFLYEAHQLFLTVRELKATDGVMKWEGQQLVSHRHRSLKRPKAFVCFKSSVSLWHLICQQPRAKLMSDLLEDVDWLPDRLTWRTSASPMSLCLLEKPDSVSTPGEYVQVCVVEAYWCRCGVFPFRTQNSMWFDFMLFYPLTGLITGTGKSNDVCLRVRVCMCENKKLSIVP